MNPKSAFYLKVLLESHHKGAIEPILKILPPPHQDMLKAESSGSGGPVHAFRDPEELLCQMHYSWIAEALQESEKKNLYFAALPQALQIKIGKILGIQGDKAPLKGPLKNYVQKQLIEKMLPEGHMPQAFLPPSALYPLLDLSKGHFIQLLDFLGIYDLAEELKKTVHTKLIKNIYAALNAKEQAFLKSCMQRKAKIQTPRFELADWNNEAKELHLRLHKRGLLRLAKALSGQDPIFIWHITHKLDTGRGKKLLSLISKNETGQITPILIEEVLQLIKVIGET